MFTHNGLGTFLMYEHTAVPYNAVCCVSVNALGRDGVRLMLGVQVADPATITSGVKSRSELLAARRYDRHHFYDRYDLDGDGVVRWFDLEIRRLLDCVLRVSGVPGVLASQVDPYEIRLGALVDLDGNGEISQDEKDYLRDLIETGKLKEISFLQDVSTCAISVTCCFRQYCSLCYWDVCECWC